MNSANKSHSVIYSKRYGYGRGRGTSTRVELADGRSITFVGRLTKAEAVRAALRQQEQAE